jgi:hypothetical protein
MIIGFFTMFPLSCARGRAEAVALPRTSLSIPRNFIGLVYSEFELIKIKLEKSNCNLLLFLGDYKFNVCYKTFRKSLPLFKENVDFLSICNTNFITAYEI